MGLRVDAIPRCTQICRTHPRHWRRCAAASSCPTLGVCLLGEAGRVQLTCKLCIQCAIDV